MTAGAHRQMSAHDAVIASLGNPYIAELIGSFERGCLRASLGIPSSIIGIHFQLGTIRSRPTARQDFDYRCHFIRTCASQ